MVIDKRIINLGIVFLILCIAAKLADVLIAYHYVWEELVR